MSSNIGGSGARARVILVLRECIWNVPMASLVLSPFDDTDFLSFPEVIWEESRLDVGGIYMSEMVKVLFWNLKSIDCI